MSTPPWGHEPESGESTPPPPPSPGQYDPPAAPYQPYAVGSPYGGYQTVPQTNGLAIASLVVSIAGLVVCCGLPGVVGAIMGHVARKQIKEQPNQTGEGMALAGIIVGWASFGLIVIGTILWVVLVIVGVVAGSSTDCYYDSDGDYVCD